MKKLLAMLVGVTIMASLFAGCGTQSSTGATSTKEPAKTEASANSTEATKDSAKDKIKIGYSVYWMSEFATLMSDAMQKKAAADPSIEFLFQDAKNDAAAQMAQVEQFISQKVDAIIVAAVDPSAMVQGAEAAKEANIPFIAVNMKVPSDAVSAYVGPDDVAAGEMMVNYCLEKLGPKFNAIVLEGAEGYSAMLDRRQGIQNILDKNKDINVLAKKTAGWTREGALQLMENYIQNYGTKIQAVIAHNDEMALGAIQALEAAGIRDKVTVVAVDAIYDACKAIKEGRQAYTVFQDAELEGGGAFDAAVTLARGGQVAEKEHYIKMIGVTKDNVDEYLAKFDKK